MTNGWTGGQYSLYRAVFGVYLFLHVLGLPTGAPFAVLLLIIGTVAAIFFVAGIYDRAAALVVCLVLGWLSLRDGLAARPSLGFVMWLLLAHASLPPSPYGAWSARHRVDPAGGWRMPQAIRAASWVVMAVGCGWALLPWFRGGGRDVLADLSALFPGLAFLALFTFDPGWVPPRWKERRDQFFYDGTCGLCHGATRFVLSEDRLGTAFSFAPLQGETFATLFPPDARRGLPDSVVVRTEDGTVLIRSDAAIRVLERLGGAWRGVAVIVRLVPAPLRDAAYDMVARLRYRLFGRTETQCPILPPHLRTRFRE